MAAARLLCPTDFSDTSATALRQADWLATTLDAELTLLHIHPIVEVALVDFTYSQVPGQTEALNVALTQRLSAWAQRLTTPPERVHCRVVMGSPVTDIVALSREYDLIVMGTHGRSGVGHFLLGSVAERVVQGAHCSVLIAKSSQEHALSHHA